MKVFAQVAAAASLAAMVASSPALAADLGGDCCADLEERIAELEATTARKGNRKVSLTIYGEINQAVLFWDDGTENNAYVVTNSTTKNLLGFEGAASITPDVRAGYRLEVELLSAPSDFVDQGQALGDEGLFGESIVIRHSNWWLDHKHLGRVTLGQGSNATDGVAEIDLSGSSALGVSSVETWNEGFFTRDKNSGALIFMFGATDAAAMVDYYRGNFDGGRGNLILYETPILGGFKLSAAWGEDDDRDIALRYAGEGGGFQFAAGIGYHEGKITDTDNFARLFGNPNAIRNHEEWMGSASVLHTSTGLFLSVAGGARDWPNTNIAGENYVYGKAGIYQRWNSLGKTSIYGEYYHIWDLGVDDSVCPAAAATSCEEKADAWGIGIVQHIDAAAMEIYAGYRHYWADDITGTDVSLQSGLPATVIDADVEFDAVMTGARIKF